MLKKLLVVAVLVAAAASMVGLSSNFKASAARSSKVTICHRTNAVNNPYVMETVSQKAVDGAGKNDHTHHTGPVASSKVVAQTLKASHIKWGDIIPPFGAFPGYNWTVDGQAVYNNGCAYPAAPAPAVLGYAVKCDVAHIQAVVTFTNTGGATGVAILNGTPVTVPVGGTTVNVPTPVGGAQVTIVIGKVKVFDQLVSCQPGKGSTGGTTTPSTPAKPAAKTAPAASLPFTAGDNTAAVTVIASAIASVALIASVIVKTALLRQS
jgi:hypothetical protein